MTSCGAREAHSARRSPARRLASAPGALRGCALRGCALRGGALRRGALRGGTLRGLRTTRRLAVELRDDRARRLRTPCALEPQARLDLDEHGAPCEDGGVP